MDFLAQIRNTTCRSHTAMMTMVSQSTSYTSMLFLESEVSIMYAMWVEHARQLVGQSWVAWKTSVRMCV
jgi:hypothetical protein